MGFLQWLTIGFTAFLFLLVITYWLEWSKPGPGGDYRREIFSALVGIEGLWIGVFVLSRQIPTAAPAQRATLDSIKTVIGNARRIPLARPSAVSKTPARTP